jgi:multiple sugar transport system permease protein
MAVTTATQRTQVQVAARAPRRQVPTGLLFVLPFLVFYALFTLWPILSGMRMSFFNTTVTGTAGEFVGLANWSEMVGDPAVWESLWHTIWFTILTVPPLVVLGLVMALLTNRAMPARALWRFSFFAPYLLPVATVVHLWNWMYQPDFGLANRAFAALGLPDRPWLLDTGLVMPALAILTLWWTVGFNFLLYLAALRGIPQDYYDAAAVDGANGWQRFWRITFPLLGRITGLIVILQILASLRVFDQIYLLTEGGANVNFVSRPIVQYVYETGFTNYRMGYAAAIAYMFFVLIAAVSVLQYRFFRSRREGRA